jgi:hypothetical protein
VFYGLRVNGTVHTGQDLLMQYVDGNSDESKNTKVEAGIAIRSVAQVLDNISNNNGRFNLIFTFNGLRCEGQARNVSKDYFISAGSDYALNIPEGSNAEDIVSWVDITSLFKKRSTGNKVSVSFTPPN